MSRKSIRAFRELVHGFGDSAFNSGAVQFDSDDADEREAAWKAAKRAHKRLMGAILPVILAAHHAVAFADKPSGRHALHCLAMQLNELGAHTPRLARRLSLAQAAREAASLCEGRDYIEQRAARQAP